ncbi:MAG TPA: glycine cleavage system protein H [Vicinamibacterales bacterium]|nr:glycine cleavage system protein H [Vicinamibacterales bacterium]
MHDPYVAKTLEYLLGIAFLVLFTGFWRYATGGATVTERVEARVPARLPLLDMFRVPQGVLLHPGHAWARPFGEKKPGLVAVGMDDFAQQLVGPLVAIDLPAVGTVLEQGSRGWRLRADSKTVDMLSPVSGRVVAINNALLEDARAISADPYGRGWLMEVEAPRLVTNTKQLLSGRAARDLMSASWDDLSRLMTPEMGTIMHDGGAPLHGFARGVDEENWDAIARRFLLT